MINAWKELSYPEWFERFKRIWGELEISEEDLRKTMRMWEWKNFFTKEVKKE